MSPHDLLRNLLEELERLSQVTLAIQSSENASDDSPTSAPFERARLQVATAKALQTCALLGLSASAWTRDKKLDKTALQVEINRMTTYIEKIKNNPNGAGPRLNLPATNRVIKGALWEDG